MDKRGRAKLAEEGGWASLKATSDVKKSERRAEQARLYFAPLLLHALAQLIVVFLIRQATKAR